MEDNQQNVEDIKKLIKATVLVFDNYRKENQAMLQQMQALDQEIHQTLNQSQKAIESTAKTTQKQLAINIEQIIDEKLDNKMADFGENEAVQNSVSRY